MEMNFFSFEQRLEYQGTFIDSKFLGHYNYYVQLVNSISKLVENHIPFFW